METSVEPVVAPDPVVVPVPTAVPAPAPTPPAEKITHVFMVLDCSGSMSTCREAAIQNFNEQVKTIQGLEPQMGKTDVTLVLFGAKPTDAIGSAAKWHPNGELIRVEYEAKPVSQLALLTQEQYDPYGNTPLFSAVLQAIEIGERIDKKGVDEAFLLVAFTDGYENASKPADLEALPAKIKAVRDTKRWTLQMMGANVDILMAHRMGLTDKEFSGYRSTHEGVQSMSKAVSSSSVSYAALRSSGQTSQDGLGVKDTTEQGPEKKS